MTQRAIHRAARLRELSPTAALLLVVGLGLATLLLAACAGATTVGVSATAAPPGHSAVGDAALDPDWRHALQIVANVKATPPSTPVVYLLGGSAARECSVSDTAWAQGVHDLGGPDVVTYDLGSRNQSFADDLKLMPFLPPASTTPTIVVIGVGLGRFNGATTAADITLPSPAPIPGSYNQHHYDDKPPLSIARKQSLVTQWLQQRYPVFKSRAGGNLKVLDRLVKYCKDNQLHPVLLDLPRNMAVIGHRFDAPIARYQKGCKAVAAKYDIPWVDFVALAHIRNSRFYDLWHLQKAGRTAGWQPRLTQKTLAWLEKYGMAPST